MPNVLIDPFDWVSCLRQTNTKLCNELKIEREGWYKASVEAKVYPLRDGSQPTATVALILWKEGEFSADVIENVEALARLRFSEFIVNEGKEAS